MSLLDEVDVIIIYVPTPLTRHREPDLTYVTETTHAIALSLRLGQLVVLESTTHPGTTDEIILPILSSTNLIVDQDFSLAYFPEHEDPTNSNHSINNIPKVASETTVQHLEVDRALYEQIIAEIVLVSLAKTAEATKILENTYRAVNIACRVSL